jgi:hypothetical protein
MATALSGCTPTWVYPMEPKFYNIITESEGMNKQYQNISGDVAILQWKLIWKGMSDTKFWALYHHFCDRKGGYAKFAWKDVPNYIDTNMDGSPDGSDVTVRYVADTFKFTPGSHSWDGEVVVEKDI